MTKDELEIMLIDACEAYMEDNGLKACCFEFSLIDDINSTNSTLSIDE